MTIGERLKEWRCEMEMSQKAAALSCGIKQPVWFRYERGETEPAADSIRKICNFFGRSADELLGLPTRGERGASLINQSVSGNHNTLTATVGAPGEMAVCKSCPKVAELKVGLENLLQTAKSGAAKLPRKK